MKNSLTKKSNLLETLKIRPADNIALNGNLAEIFRGEGEFKKIGGIKQVTRHVLAPDRIGGNHFHKLKYEIMYVLNGELTAYLKDPDKPEVYKQIIREGQKFDLIPEIAHALHSRRGSEIIEFTNLVFDSENPGRDVYPCRVFYPENQ